MGLTQQRQPIGGHSRYAVNLADLAKPVKESQKQHKLKATAPTPQDNYIDNGNNDAAMESDAQKEKKDTHRCDRNLQVAEVGKGV